MSTNYDEPNYLKYLSRPFWNLEQTARLLNGYPPESGRKVSRVQNTLEALAHDISEGRLNAEVYFGEICLRPGTAVSWGKEQCIQVPDELTHIDGPLHQVATVEPPVVQDAQTSDVGNAVASVAHLGSAKKEACIALAQVFLLENPPKPNATEFRKSIYGKAIVAMFHTGAKSKSWNNYLQAAKDCRSKAGRPRN